MINFILYDNDKKLIEVYERIIREFLYKTEDCYKIYEFNCYDKATQNEHNQIEGKKIFFINVDSDIYNGSLIAKDIRSQGDFTSPIIFITQRNISSVVEMLHNVLYLDIIYKDEKFIQKLLKSLNEAYKIVTRHSVYTFSIFDEIYRIPYKDIYYIRKNLNENSVTVYTRDDSYMNYTSVKNVENVLREDARFFKAHRSCIINLYNVESYNKKDNLVVFNNGMTINLISKPNRSKLAKKLKYFETEDI